MQEKLYPWRWAILIGMTVLLVSLQFSFIVPGGAAILVMQQYQCEPMMFSMIMSIPYFSGVLFCMAGGVLADRLGLAVAPVLARPRSRDQRALARRDRLAKMEGRFIPLPGASAFPSVILVDDVYTTGATLFAATDAVRVAGAATVRCLTFARVW